MNKISSTRYIVTVITVILCFVIYIAYNSGYIVLFGFIPVCCVCIWSILSLHDIYVENEGFMDISLFSRKIYFFSDIDVLSIKVLNGPCFYVITSQRVFIFAYTKNNYKNLQLVIEKSRSSRISLLDLETTVKKSFFSLKR